jgi:hypothetical protein
VAKVVETQTSLERQLELIETHQKEVGMDAYISCLLHTLVMTFVFVACLFALSFADPHG